MDILLPLISTPVLFLIVTLVKPHVTKILPWNLCAVCVAVSLTWMILLVLFWMGIATDPIPLAVLMGMSVTGIMSKVAAAYERRRLNLAWLARLIVVLGGFLTVVSVIRGDLGVALFSGVLSLVLLTIVTFLLQGTTHEDAVKSAEGYVHKSLLKKLDHCC